MTRDEAIISAFSSTETLDEIASRLGASRSTIQRVWKCAQNSGLLPFGSRPNFATASGHFKDDDAEIDFETMSDAEFAAYEQREADRNALRQRANAISCEALLAALIREHGMPRRMSNGAILPPAGMAPDISEEIVAHLAREKSAEVLA